jgi:hypothetical protein
VLFPVIGLVILITVPMGAVWWSASIFVSFKLSSTSETAIPRSFTSLSPYLLTGNLRRSLAFWMLSVKMAGTIVVDSFGKDGIVWTDACAVTVDSPGIFMIWPIDKLLLDKLFNAFICSTVVLNFLAIE